MLRRRDLAEPVKLSAGRKRHALVGSACHSRCRKCSRISPVVTADKVIAMAAQSGRACLAAAFTSDPPVSGAPATDSATTAAKPSAAHRQRPPQVAASPTVRNRAPFASP
jgi:hypothetical protein